jgi:hypothetical protein
MTLEDTLTGKEIPDDIKSHLVLVTVPYTAFDGTFGQGQLVVHEDLADEVRHIFEALYARAFPIEKMLPITAYGWDDEASMRDNNSSAFNYRTISGTEQLSMHAFGRAIDINPFLNPYIKDGVVMPQGAHYDPARKGSVTPEIAAVFKSYGWEWGGEWESRKDWQHFEKQ